MSVCLSGDKDNNDVQRRWSVRALCGTSFCASIHCPLHHHSSSSFSSAWLVGHLGLRGIDGWVCNNIDGCVCVMGREGSFVTCTWSLCEEVATGDLPFRNRLSLSVLFYVDSISFPWIEREGSDLLFLCLCWDLGKRFNEDYFFVYHLCTCRGLLLITFHSRTIKLSPIRPGIGLCAIHFTTPRNLKIRLL